MKSRKGRDLDPDVLFGSVRSSRSNHKTAQVCAEVQRAVSFALACDCHDSVLRDAYVEEVVPIRGASRLAVTLRCPMPPGTTYSELLERVHVFAPEARRSVARQINRKHAPELELVLLVGEEGP